VENRLWDIATSVVLRTLENSQYRGQL
jgi:hypothetical protein